MACGIAVLEERLLGSTGLLISSTNTSMAPLGAPFLVSGTEVLPMMKQPPENTNALPEEEAEARQSASRIYMDSPAVKEEIAMRAHYYWQERRAPGGAPEQEDWERAESFVRNRIKASQTA